MKHFQKTILIILIAFFVAGLVLSLPSVASATADLSITMSDFPDPVQAGQTLTYTITVTNNGPDDALNVRVTNTLPAGVTFVSTSGCLNDITGGVPSCFLGECQAGDSVQYTIEVTVDSECLIINEASVSSNTPEPDPDPNSNFVAEETNGNNIELLISKTDDVDPIQAGQTLTYIIRVTNCDSSAASNVEVTDTLPAGVTFDTTFGCAEDPNGLPTCTLGFINAGASDGYGIRVTVDADTFGTITNQASVSSDNFGPIIATEDTTVNLRMSMPGILLLLLGE